MATVSFDEMKLAVIGLYPNPRWKYRVDKMMPNDQIVAIYFTALREGRFRKKDEDKCYRQLNLFKDFGLS